METTKQISLQDSHMARKEIETTRRGAFEAYLKLREAGRHYVAESFYQGLQSGEDRDTVTVRLHEREANDTYILLEDAVEEVEGQEYPFHPLNNVMQDIKDA